MTFLPLYCHSLSSNMIKFLHLAKSSMVTSCHRGVLASSYWCITILVIILATLLFPHWFNKYILLDVLVKVSMSISTSCATHYYALHDRTSNKLFIVQLLYFMSISYAKQIEKRGTYSEPIEPVFFTEQNNQLSYIA